MLRNASSHWLGGPASASKGSILGHRCWWNLGSLFPSPPFPLHPLPHSLGQGLGSQAGPPPCALLSPSQLLQAWGQQIGCAYLFHSSSVSQNS